MYHIHARTLEVSKIVGQYKALQDEHPKRFIEDSTANSWIEYLTNVSQKVHGVIIHYSSSPRQTVLNSRIRITESNPRFAEI